MTEAVAVEGLRADRKATLEVKDVKSLRLPELTHDFLHNFGVHSTEQFAEMVRTLLDRRLEYTQAGNRPRTGAAAHRRVGHLGLANDMLMRQAHKALQRRVLEMREAA